MKKKIFTELEKKVNAIYDSSVVVMRNEQDKVEKISGRSNLCAIANRVRFHEFIIGLPHTNLLSFILARTIPFGKVFCVIRDSEFIIGIPEVLNGCGISGRGLQYAKKELIDRHLIRAIILYQGKKKIGVVYAVSPIDIIKQCGGGFRRLPEWRRILLLGLCEFFGAFIYMPTILRVNTNFDVVDETGETIDERIDGEESVADSEKECRCEGEKQTKKRKEKETKAEKVINFFR